MRSLRLKNFRSLVDTGRIELRPLTVLVGANSSGKSSFLRFFPLLRQTYEARSASPLLWYGRDVDFGDFSQVVRRGAEPKEIEVEMGFDMRVGTDEVLEMRSTTTIAESEGKTHTARYTLSCGTTAFTMSFAPEGFPLTIVITANGAVIHQDGPANLSGDTVREHAYSTTTSVGRSDVGDSRTSKPIRCPCKLFARCWWESWRTRPSPAYGDAWTTERQRRWSSS